MTTAPETEGRSARSAKTRDAIADALLDLLAAGHLRPTAREIADQAGVSVRSVYVHFDDLEDLFCVAATRHYARIAPTLERVAPDGTVAERAGALVDRRVRLYTKIGDVGRATRLQAPFSPTLARIIRDSHTRSTRELTRLFAPEIAGRDDARRAALLAMLEVVTSATTWETLLEVHHLSPEDAAGMVVATVVALFEDEV
jgi:AcrR family transcriptional regulator